MTDFNTPASRLEQARALVAHLEAGEDAQAEAVIAGLTRAHESSLFQELGRLTRELHSAINGFLLDDRLHQLASQDIPDATERLRYVITMTEQSANTTLNAVESGLPVLERLCGQAKHFSDEWQRFRDRQLSVEAFRQLVADMAEFLNQVERDGNTVQSQLSEVLMAQGFQDLTGQIIRKVIRLVQDMEEKLVNIIRLSGDRLSIEPPAREPLPPHAGEGPAVPGVDVVDQVQGQDQVDDLLSSLGF